MSSRGSDSGSSSPPVINTEDMTSRSCGVCRFGSRRPALTSPPPVQIPTPSSRVSVRRLVSDIHVLTADNRALRVQVEETAALNAGLAAHASVLHDRNLALLRRGREGFDLGMATFDRLQCRVEELEAENVRLTDVAAGLQTAASQSHHWATRYRVLEATSYEEDCFAQDSLAAAQSHAAGLELQLAAGNAQISDLASQLEAERALVVTLRTRLALSSSPPIVPVAASASEEASSTSLILDLQTASAGLQARLDDALRKRDDAILESESLGQQLVVLHREMGVVQDELVRSRAETEAARQLNVDDIRRVNAMLTAYAEERQRDLDRTRDLEASVSVAEAARVAAQADQTRSQAVEIQAVARSEQYRRGWLDIRRAAEQARVSADARIHRLSTRVIDLEGDLDRVRRDSVDRVTARHRLPREARRGRETARRVVAALSARLVAVVDAAGGIVAVDDLVRSVEVAVGPAVVAAVPLPPDDVQLAEEGRFTASPTAPASPRSRSQSSSRPNSPSHPTATPSRGSRCGAPSHSPNVASALLSGSSAMGFSAGLGASSPRRSRCPSTAADTAASDSAVAQRQRPGALLSDSSSDSAVRARNRRTKCRRLRRRASRSGSSSRSSSTGRLTSPTRSPSRSRSASGERSHGSVSPRRSGSSSRSRSIDSSNGGDSSLSSSSGSTPLDPISDATPAPFFTPVIPPASDRHVWSRRLTRPWPQFLRRSRLSTISARQIRSRCLPPPLWIFPEVPEIEPASWNVSIVTLPNVTLLYDTRPWCYLTQVVGDISFEIGDASFQRFLARYRVHLDHWAQAYWESTHELVVSGPEWEAWRRQRNSRLSHAGDHFLSVLQLVVELFEHCLANMDLLLDLMMLHFAPRRSGAGRWYPGLQHATLQEALNAIDAQEPWRRFFRSPLTVAEMDAGVPCTVTRAHPAVSLPRLQSKFIQEI